MFFVWFSVEVTVLDSKSRCHSGDGMVYRFSIVKTDPESGLWRLSVDFHGEHKGDPRPLRKTGGKDRATTPLTHDDRARVNRVVEALPEENVKITPSNVQTRLAVDYPECRIPSNGVRTLVHSVGTGGRAENMFGPVCFRTYTVQIKRNTVANS